MASPERSGEFKLDPRYREAFGFCQDIQRALVLWQKIASNDVDDWQEAHRLAVAAAESIIHQSAFGGLKFRLSVAVPPETNAHISRNWQIIEDKSQAFEASEIRSIDSRGIEFHDIISDNWLVVFGHNVQVNPVLPEVQNQT